MSNRRAGCSGAKINGRHGRTDYSTDPMIIILCNKYIFSSCNVQPQKQCDVR
jgi:hypothetical protein